MPKLVWWQRLLLDEEGLGEVSDPNVPSWLCRECAKEYHDYWDAMWEEHRYASL